MTDKDIFNMGIGGFEELSMIINALNETAYCLIGGLALNCYVDPVYTSDADFSIAPSDKESAKNAFIKAGFKVKENRYDMSIFIPGSKLTVHVTTDAKYKDFPKRAKYKNLFGELSVKTACLEDLIKGKTWAMNDPNRKETKKIKDFLDLMRIGDEIPKMRKFLPDEVLKRLNIKTKSQKS